MIYNVECKFYHRFLNSAALLRQKVRLLEVSPAVQNLIWEAKRYGLARARKKTTREHDKVKMAYLNEACSLGMTVSDAEVLLTTFYKRAEVM